MSTPLNPLSNYNSAAYYHVLAICDSTETADALSSSTYQEVWESAQAINTPSHLWAKYGKRAPKEIELNDRAITGRYSILIHGAKDADFSIEYATWNTVTTANVTENDNDSSIAIQGALTIIEPKGIVFSDTIVQMCIEMGIDSAQAVYVIKTFFVGHSSDASIPNVIADVRPIQVVFTTLTGKFTEAGGVYTVNFTALQHGITRQPQYSSVAESLNIKSGSTLKQTIDKLNIAIQRQYDRVYTCVAATFEQNLTAEEFASVKKRLAPVKYTIELDPMYRDDSFIVDSQLADVKDSPVCDSEVQLSFKAGTQIEEAIRKVMATCRKVTDMQNGVVDGLGGKRYGFKIYPKLNSIFVEDADNAFKQMEYIVTYTIKPYVEPLSIDIATIMTSDDESERQKLENNLIQFDYLFTGKNIDILDFDIAVNYGIAYLQTASMANSALRTFGNPTSDKQIVVSGQTMSQVNRLSEDARVPIFFSTPITSDLYKNHPNLQAAGQAIYNLNNHASLEVQNSTIKILGNPNILSSTNIASFTNSTASNKSNVLTNFGEYPAFVKINIKMPRNNNEQTLYTSTDDNGNSYKSYAENFWFQGYYYISMVKHEFDRGLFTQTLSLIAQAQPTDIETNVVERNNTPIDFTTKIGKCCDDQKFAEIPRSQTVLSFSALPSPATVGKNEWSQEDIDRLTRKLEKSEVEPVTASPSPQEATIAADNGHITVSNVKKYNAQPENIKLAIRNASKMGVNEVSLAQFAYIESTFNPKAANPGSNARGLYQFIPSTWLSLAKNGRITGLDKTLSDSELLEYRFSETYAANAAAELMKESQRNLIKNGVDVNTTSLYMCHQLGWPRAVKVLKAIKTGAGSANLDDVITAPAIRSIKSTNPEFKSAKTPIDMWNITDRKIANSLTDVVSVAPTTESVRATTDTTTKTSSFLNPSDEILSQFSNPTALDKLMKAKGRETPDNSADSKIDCTER